MKRVGLFGTEIICRVSEFEGSEERENDEM